MDKQFYVYIMTNKPGGLFYVGVTNSIVARVYQHKNDLVEGFTKRYQLHKLVYLEAYATATEAIQREKHLKAWKRAWKIRLIKTENPEWRDLYEDFWDTQEARIPSFDGMTELKNSDNEESETIAAT